VKNCLSNANSSASPVNGNSSDSAVASVLKPCVKKSQPKVGAKNRRIRLRERDVKTKKETSETTGALAPEIVKRRRRKKIALSHVVRTRCRSSEPTSAKRMDLIQQVFVWEIRRSKRAPAASAKKKSPRFPAVKTCGLTTPVR